MNEEINKVVLENTPKNAQYIAPNVKKKLLNILAKKVRYKIRKEIVDTIDSESIIDEFHCLKSRKVQL